MGAVLHFTFDGKAIPFEEGDTLGSALHRAGIRTISRSLKYHRPRGLYCCTGSCASCLVAVDGVPNVPACMERAQAGLDVDSQNTLGGAKRDLYSVVDKVYRKGFDPHAAFTKSTVMNKVFLKTVRHMSGLGDAPTEARPSDAKRFTKHVHHLIIGAGFHGLNAAKEQASKRRSTLIVDELPRIGGSALWDPLDDAHALAAEATKWPGVEVWTDAVAFGYYDDMVAVRLGDDLYEITADRITLAPGTHDAWPLFDGNDKPGVLSLRGAQRLMGEHGVLAGKRIVIHGQDPGQGFADQVNALGGEVVARGLVEAAAGNPAVAKAKVDGKWVRCDAVVCNIPGMPRIQLFQQAGCALTFTDGALRPAMNDGGKIRDGLYGGLP